jgi:hypothetical protein
VAVELAVMLQTGVAAAELVDILQEEATLVKAETAWAVAQPLEETHIVLLTAQAQEAA